MKSEVDVMPFQRALKAFKPGHSGSGTDPWFSKPGVTAAENSARTGFRKEEMTFHKLTSYYSHHFLHLLWQAMGAVLKQKQ